MLYRDEMEVRGLNDKETFSLVEKDCLVKFGMSWYRIGEVFEDTVELYPKGPTTIQDPPIIATVADFFTCSYIKFPAQKELNEIAAKYNI